MDTITILVIEHEPIINRILSKYFMEEGYIVLNAYDGIKGLELFNENKVNLVCLDITMPKVDGLDVAKSIRKTSDIPIIMMSALSTEKDILKGYSLKIDDYVTKPFNPKILVAKIKSLIERIGRTSSYIKISGFLEYDGVKMNLSSHEERRKLSDLLTKDDLTGIANRRYLDFQLSNMKKEVETFNSTFGILFIDIDHFKNVNDTYGHKIGDEILKLVSRTLNSKIRSEDIIGRWGGEEFIAALKIENIHQLKNKAEKLREIISETYYELDNLEKLNVTISIGGTMYENAEDLASLVSRADANMYKSKQTGRNKVTVT